ncbi:hypothetical protein DL770_003037 [Monosporascus sp. CRB-9-2]|nr:hypothetical protein DL770_003037 [Monosporascus sp. CRB-9-2]
MDHGRDPCPWVILNDFGGAFSMGAIGGTIWHGIKGFRNSPYGERRIGAVTAIKARAPVLGGNFGVWGGLFSTFDCAVKGVRKKEDPYNAIIAGFFTGGSLAIRGGYKAARNGAIGCAVLLAVIEGVGIGFQRMLAGSTKLEDAKRPNEDETRKPPKPPFSDADDGFLGAGETNVLSSDYSDFNAPNFYDNFPHPTPSFITPYLKPCRAVVVDPRAEQARRVMVVQDRSAGPDDPAVGRVPLDHGLDADHAALALAGAPPARAGAALQLTPGPRDTR